MADTYEAIAGLALEIDDYALDGLVQTVSSGFERRTTVIRLRGGSEEGIGEDVTYEGDDHLRQLELGPVLPLAGDWTVDSFSSHVAGLDLFPGGAPDQPAYLLYRRWAFESAALDPRAAPGRPHPGRRARARSRARALRVSPRGSGSPRPSRPWAAGSRSTPTCGSSSTPPRTSTTGSSSSSSGRVAVDSIDFKGAYKGTSVDVPTDPGLYKRIAEAFPRGLARGSPTCRCQKPTPRSHPTAIASRWDAPIHSWRISRPCPSPRAREL
jgi:hypothetical protein